MRVLAAFIVILAVAGILASQMLYTVDMRQQAVITEFGKPIVPPITEPGLLPLFQQSINILSPYTPKSIIQKSQKILLKIF